MKKIKNKTRKFVICSDVHGDMQCPLAVKAFFRHVEILQPDIRIANGDIFDFRNLRRGASDDEQHESLEKDFNMGVAFLNKFFYNTTSENHFLRGNHDERLWQLLTTSKGLVRDYSKMTVKTIENHLKKDWNANMLPYDSEKGVLHLGKLKVLHGYHAGMSAGNSHARVYGNCVYGHTHAIEVGSVPSFTAAEARGIGCLCVRDMDYMNRNTGKLRWANGWAYGNLYPDGSYQIFQARAINGKFTIASSLIDL